MTKRMTFRDIDRHVGKRIRLGRQKAGVTQNDLAEHLEVSFQQVQKYEGGTNRISAGKLYRTAELSGPTQ